MSYNFNNYITVQFQSDYNVISMLNEREKRIIVLKMKAKIFLERNIILNH